MLKPHQMAQGERSFIRPRLLGFLAFTILLPLAAHAQSSGSPFDTGFTALQTLFTGTIAKVASLIAIVIGGYGFAHGEPGAKKTPARAAGRSTAPVLPRGLVKRQQGEAHPAPCPPSSAVD